MTKINVFQPLTGNNKLTRRSHIVIFFTHNVKQADKCFGYLKNCLKARARPQI